MIYIFLEDAYIVNPLNISPMLFNMTINIVIAGTILIFLELLLVGVLFETIKKHFKNYELISLIYTAIFLLIIILDGILFPILAFALDPNLVNMISGSFQGKLILGIAFSIPILLFLLFNREKLSQYIEQPLPLRNLILWPKKKLIQQIQESEEKYREAYDWSEFYKDLFAHDISNILQNIKSSVGLLALFHNKPEKGDKINELMEIINNQVARGGNMVSNVRKLSQLAESKKGLKSLDLIEVLTEVIQLIKKSYLERNIEIQIQCQIDEIFVEANEFLLDIFGNILINAINYNESPKIEISIVVSKEKENKIRYVKIETKDNGIGIPDELKEGLFQKEIMVKDKSKRMGLGLLLVNKLVSFYNGKIWVEDKDPRDYSKGSNFVILLPEVK